MNENAKRNFIFSVFIMITFTVIIACLGYSEAKSAKEKKQKNEITPKSVTTVTSTPKSTVTPMPTATPVPIKKIVKYKKGKLISTYTISNWGSSCNRNINLSTYCKAINKNWKKKGYMVRPQQQFEWYSAIDGEPTVKNGYKPAPVIVNHQHVDGIGGGACQVASTINNAILKLGIETKAIGHSDRPAYFGPNDKEASVAYGQKTFSFVNTKKYPILVKMKANAGSVTCKVFKMKKTVKYVEKNDTKKEGQN